MIRLSEKKSGLYQIEVTGLFISRELVEFIKNEINQQPTHLGIYYHWIENANSFKFYLRGVSYEHCMETFVKFSHWIMDKTYQKTLNTQ